MWLNSTSGLVWEHREHFPITKELSRGSLEGNLSGEAALTVKFSHSPRDGICHTPECSQSCKANITVLIKSISHSINWVSLLVIMANPLKQNAISAEWCLNVSVQVVRNSFSGLMRYPPDRNNVLYLFISSTQACIVAFIWAYIWLGHQKNALLWRSALGAKTMSV